MALSSNRSPSAITCPGFNVSARVQPLLLCSKEGGGGATAPGGGPNWALLWRYRVSAVAIPCQCCGDAVPQYQCCVRCCDSEWHSAASNLKFH